MDLKKKKYIHILTTISECPSESNFPLIISHRAPNELWSNIYHQIVGLSIL